MLTGPGIGGSHNVGRPAGQVRDPLACNVGRPAGQWSTVLAVASAPPASPSKRTRGRPICPSSSGAACSPALRASSPSSIASPSNAMSSTSTDADSWRQKNALAASRATVDPTVHRVLAVVVASNRQLNSNRTPSSFDATPRPELNGNRDPSHFHASTAPRAGFRGSCCRSRRRHDRQISTDPCRRQQSVT